MAELKLKRDLQQQKEQADLLGEKYTDLQKKKDELSKSLKIVPCIKVNS